MKLKGSFGRPINAKKEAKVSLEVPSRGKKMENLTPLGF